MSTTKPADFLKRLKQTEALDYKMATPPVDFIAIHQEQEKQLGVAGVNPESILDGYFAEMLKVIVEVLPQPIQTEVVERIAVGCVNNAEVNAFIVRDGENHCFAVLINRALVTMVNHYAKLIASARHPSSVLYCNGMPVEQLRRADYSKMSTEMLAKYGSTGTPVGPSLKIALKSDAMSFVDTALNAMYLFLLGHELGHYINGDLSSLSNFRKCNWGGELSIFGSNPSHTMEFKADKIAFELVLRVLNAKEPNFSARLALDFSVTLIFNFMRDISNRGNATHPRPSLRQLAITKEFFGEEAAEIMEKSFNDLTQIAVFQAKVGNQTVSEVLKVRGTL